MAMSDKAKDPICGMVVDKSTPLRAERNGRVYYFCSTGCQHNFESPERELKSMKHRVTIAMSGVLALALLRASAFIALATSASLICSVIRLSASFDLRKSSKLSAVPGSESRRFSE